MMTIHPSIHPIKTFKGFGKDIALDSILSSMGEYNGPKHAMKKRIIRTLKRCCILGLIDAVVSKTIHPAWVVVVVILLVISVSAMVVAVVVVGLVRRK